MCKVHNFQYTSFSNAFPVIDLAQKIICAREFSGNYNISTFHFSPQILFLFNAICCFTTDCSVSGGISLYIYLEKKSNDADGIIIWHKRMGSPPFRYMVRWYCVKLFIHQIRKLYWKHCALLATIYLQGLCTGTGGADLSWLPAEDPAVESPSAPAAWSSSSVWHTPNHSTTVSIKTIGFVNICYTTFTSIEKLPILKAPEEVGLLPIFKVTVVEWSACATIHLLFKCRMNFKT